MKRLPYFAFILLLSGIGETYSASGTKDPYAAWQASRDQLIQDKSLVRYYTFEQPGDEVPNLAGDKRGSFIVSVREPYFNAALHPRVNVDFPQWTSGRFPGKPALGFRSATGNVSGSMFYGTASGTLTLEAWVRLRGPDEKSDGILFSVGAGFEEGWVLRATASDTSLRIGRPADEGGDVDLSVKPLTPGGWHHLVAVLDHHTLRLYVDGELAGTKDFSGDFSRPKAPVGYLAQNPDEDRGGLKIGSIREPENTLFFDCDELALYDRVLSVEEVRARFEAGQPAESIAEQELAYRALLEKQALLAELTIAIPTESYGYFPAGKPMPLTLAVPTTVKLSGPLAVKVSIRSGDQKPLFSETKNLALSGKEEARLVWDLPLPELRGLYEIDVSLTDSTGAVVAAKSFPIATTVPVPAIADRPLSSPLGGHGIISIHNEDIAIGARYERLIPWCPKQPDGKPGFQYADSDVELAEKSGLEILFCIDPRWDMGQVDLTKVENDPSEWENWVRAFIERYKGRVKYWEIVNEPNAGKNISPPLYVVLLKSASRIIREVDPAAKIVGICGVTSYPEWTEDVLTAGGSGYFDILSFHNYIGSSPISAWRRDGKLERTQATLKKLLGKQIPIWNSESGLEQPRRVNGHSLNDAELLEKYPTRSRVENGITLVSANAITLATEHVGTCWQMQSILLDLALGVERYFMLMGASNFYPRSSGSEGMPSEKGIAYAALASVLTPMKSIQLLPIASSSEAGVMVTELNGKNTVALFADAPTTRCFTVSGNRTYAGMDYLGNPLTWEAPDNLLTVSYGMEPVYIFDVPADFKEVQFLEVKQFPALVSPGKKVDGLLVVTNPFSVPLTGELKMTAPQSTVTLATNLTLKPGERREVPFQMDAGPLPRGNHVLSVSLSQNGKSLSSAEYPFGSEGVAEGVPRVQQAFKLDGDTSEWDSIPAEVADSASQVVAGRPPVGYYDANAWKGPKDLSFSVKTAWRPKDGIYVLISVNDDTLKTVPPDQVGSAYLQDSLELFFDGRTLKEQTPTYSRGVEQILVVPSIEDVAKPCLVKNLARSGESVDVEFVSKRTPSGYVIEGRIRPKDGTSFQLIPGARFSMDALIDDGYDTSFSRRTQMALHGTASNNSDASNFGRYYLMSEEVAPVVNLLQNAEIIQGDDGVVPAWTFVKEVKEAADAAKVQGSVNEVDGKRALGISVSSESASHCWWEQRVPATGETAYAVSFRLKGQIDGKAAYCNGGGNVFFLGDQSAWLGSQTLANVEATSAGDWGTFSGKIMTPAGTQALGFRFNVLSGGLKGTADFSCADIVVSQPTLTNR